VRAVLKFQFSNCLKLLIYKVQQCHDADSFYQHFLHLLHTLCMMESPHPKLVSNLSAMSVTVDCVS